MSPQIRVHPGPCLEIGSMQMYVIKMSPYWIKVGPNPIIGLCHFIRSDTEGQTQRRVDDDKTHRENAM